MTAPLLEGVLVDLVPYGDDYFAQEHRWWNSEASFWASAGSFHPTTRAQIKRNQDRAREHRQPGQSQSIWFGIRSKGGAVLGDMTVNEFNPTHRTAALGAMIGEPEFWGGGYGTDALLLLVEYCFDWLDARKVWLGTMGLNVRVHRQMEKVGFKREAVSRQHWFAADHGWTDDVIYGLLRAEWPGRVALVDKLNMQPRPDPVTD